MKNGTSFVTNDPNGIDQTRQVQLGGSTTIKYSNGAEGVVFVNGTEETIFKDGTKVVTHEFDDNDDKLHEKGDISVEIITYTNGTVIETKLF